MFEYRKIENNETPDVCKSCGKCCKNYPGAYHPEQFEDLSKEKILEMLASNKYAIDAYCDDYVDDICDSNYVYGYFIRPLGSDENPSKTHGQYRTIGCCHLTLSGCDLPFEERPYGCQKLTPDTCMNIDECDTKLDISDVWKEYHDILDDIVKTNDITLTPMLFHRSILDMIF